MPPDSWVDRKREAVKAWLTWRNLRAVAEAPAGAKPGADPLRVMLSQWWDAEELPKIEQASGVQLDRALAQITKLEYGERPF